MRRRIELDLKVCKANLPENQFMRIDLIITEMETGGAEKCCAELAIFLSKRGHRVRVIALGPRPVESKSSLVRFLESHNIELHFLGGRKWWMFPGVISKLRRLVKSDRPDVVQSFLWHANVVSAWVASSLRIPFFAGIRITERRRARHALDRWSTSRSQKTICVSQGVADWCVHSERMDAGKLLVIPNGIEILAENHPIPTNPQSVPANARILLFVGRLEPQKGIDVLAHHAEELLSLLPDHHLVLIGDGSQRKLLETIAQQQNLTGRIHFLGQRNDVRTWMARSELLLLPSRYEGMPNVILEAMAERLPVVTTRVEGVAELLGDQLEPQSVAKEAWDDFFKLAVSLANSSKHRTELGTANHKRATTEFALDRQLERYEALYLF